MNDGGMVASATAPRLRTLSLDVAPNRGYPQHGFVTSTARYAGYFAGVGSGKTMALVVDAFQYATLHPKSIQVITEPSHQMLKDILIPKIVDMFGETRGAGRAFEMTESPPIDVRFWNGSQLWLRTAEAGERLYGLECARVLMDEVTVGQQEEVHDILLQRTRQPGFPHQLKMTGTPKGRNWVWKRYIDQPVSGVEIFQCATQDNQHLPEGYFEALLEQYGGWDSPLARQELGASWLLMAGQVYPQFSRQVHIRTLATWQPTEAMLEGGTAIDEHKKASSIKEVIGGIDFGAVSPTALVVLGLDGGGRAWAMDEWYQHEATIEKTIKAMVDLAQRYGVRRWIADPAGKAEIQQLRNAGFRVSPARHGNKIAMRTQLIGARLNVSLATKHPGMYFDPRCTSLISEIEGLMWARRKVQGRTEEQLQDKFDPVTPDHACDALSCALSDFDSAAPPWKRPRKPIPLWPKR